MERRIGDRKKVAVIGAGIIGLPSAHRILSETFASVTLISETFSPATTGDNSAGLIMPFTLADTPADLVTRWTKETWDYLRMLTEANIQPDLLKMAPAYELYKDSEKAEETPGWAEVVKDFRKMTDHELQRFQHMGVKSGHFFETQLLDVSGYLQWLLKRFCVLGGRVIQKKITRLSELYEDFDIIVNCTGLSSYHLVGDKTLYPVRGMVSKVYDPEVREIIAMDTESEPLLYIIPGFNSVVTVGGTALVNDWSTEDDAQMRSKMIEQATAVMPSLRKGTILKDWVGLRPGRNSVRLECEHIVHGTKHTNVIHNYGHGGSGVTVFWGCAADVLKMVRQCFLTSHL